LPAGTYYLSSSSYDVLIDVNYGGMYCFSGSCNPLDANPITLASQQSISDVNFVLIPTADFVFMAGFE